MKYRTSSPLPEKYSVYFWAPAVSPHLLPIFNALKSHPRISRAVYVGQKAWEPLRQSMGWEINLPEDAVDVISDPNSEQIDRIVRESDPNSIHIFWGIRWVPCLKLGLKGVIKYGRRFGILSEPRVFEGGKGILRWVHSILTERTLRRRADFVFAIGAHGPKWFSMVGYDRERIFPFAYFLNLRANYGLPILNAEDRTNVRVAFVGRLEKQKGFDLFLGAISKIKRKMDFLIVGRGSLEHQAREQVKRDKRINFCGVVPMSEIPGFMKTIDILVLPSITTDDGWGAVISESLMAGAAVITSSKVGASICIDVAEKGIVLKKNNSETVAEAIQHLVNGKLLGSHYRQKRSQWASRHLDSATGAKYTIDIFDHLFYGAPKPVSFLDFT